MKAFINPILLLLLTGCQSCDLFEKPRPKTELEKLPLATQVGNNTWGCLINGKAWYETYPSGDYQIGSLSISANELIFAPVIQGMGFDLTESVGDKPLDIGEYSLLPTASYDPYATTHRNGCWYGGSNYRNDVVSGNLVITKFDKSKFIVSGSFEFVIVHTNCDTLRITNGRFDIHYAP